MEDLDKILGYVWVETTGGDAPLSEAYPELKQVLTEWKDKEVVKAKPSYPFAETYDFLYRNHKDVLEELEQHLANTESNKEGVEVNE